MTDHRYANQANERKTRIFCSFLAAIVVSSVFLFSGCLDDGNTEEIKPAEYGDYGKNIAMTLASEFPERYAYSEQEREAGLLIKDELTRMGYTVEEQEFYDSYRAHQSTNYIVRIPGEGFMLREEGELYTPIKRTVVVGVHYDIAKLPNSEMPDPVEPDPTATTTGESDENGTQESIEPTEAPRIYDGIHANASGVACLLTIADRIRAEKPAYDVILVAFGAGTDDFCGARAFLSSMTTEERESIDVMYCVDSIYAGDKLYASSGLSSLLPGRKYEFRRKLYEAYDVVYNNTLRSLNGVDLYYNESGIYIDANNDDIADIYREVTVNRSDYVPFDEAEIPIVFFESFEYNAPVLSEMKETKNLNLQEEGGFIRGTSLDASAFLEQELGPDRLRIRVNNTAFIIIEAIDRGPHDTLPVSRYNDGERLDKIIRVTETIPYQSR